MYSRLSILKKRDMIKEKYQSNLITQEIVKTERLIGKIDEVIKDNMDHNKSNISGSYFKSFSSLMSLLNKQKSIEKNKKEFLKQQRQIHFLKATQKQVDRENIAKKILKVKNQYNEEIELKNQVHLKKNNTL